MHAAIDADIYIYSWRRWKTLAGLIAAEEMKGMIIN